jgi:plasmid stabilization system protein ParE
MAERRWRIRLGAEAELDFANILKWTTENFGARQSRVYRETLFRRSAGQCPRHDRYAKPYCEAPYKRR